ncbi:2OG-Fe(II) oxygenase [Cellulophaga geojensis KL-A]|uniref:2OG-Fe(II) oxygenase n=1 Tax=Cellulophaga geojensis KL-A TaxID=1328323 RepID=A0ABN0RNB2_9FLAO|nr:2OG-Fe(II) oxygenase [Cellulophaga geojensis KL-A]
MDELSCNDYVVIDNFLDTSTYLEVREFFLSKLNYFAQAGIGALDKNAVHTEIRGDYTFWLTKERDTEIAAFWEVVDQAIQVFNRYCFLSLSGYEFHFANYPPGGHYTKHLDQFKNRNNRTISFIVYLNEGWQKGDGGELEIFKPDNSSFLVEPLAGRCVLFKSDVVPHAVLKSYKDRYSLTGWLLQTPFKLGQFLG